MNENPTTIQPNTKKENKKTTKGLWIYTILVLIAILILLIINHRRTSIMIDCCVRGEARGIWGGNWRNGRCLWNSGDFTTPSRPYMAKYCCIDALNEGICNRVYWERRSG